MAVGRSEIETHAEFYRMALNNYKANWPRLIFKLPSRLIHFWLTSHSAMFGIDQPISVYRQEGRWGPIVIRAVLWVFELATLILAFWEMYLRRTNWTIASTLAFAGFCYYSLHIFVGYWDNRYQLPALALLIIFSGAALSRIFPSSELQQNS